jgi:glycosyltransferase involved in cell wall biosynthesis
MKPKVSICVPIHDMKDGDKFLWRLVNSLTEQTFKDWELIITKDGKMAENTNSSIKRARGDLIKILYLDDYFSSDFALEDIVFNFKDDTEWLITGCSTNQVPYWTDDIETGNNKLGSPSVLTFRNRFADNLLFDENMSWLLDCDYYRRMYDRFGEPKIMPVKNIIIGEGDHQMTHILTDEEKMKEYIYMNKKHE